MMKGHFKVNLMLEAGGIDNQFGIANPYSFSKRLNN